MDNDNQVVSVGEWIVSILVVSIPIIGFIMMFVWAFSSPKKSKANFFKAGLVMSAVSILLYFIFAAALSELLLSLSQMVA